MASQLNFGEKTRMIAIEIPNEDVFFFHENLLRYHSSYIDEVVRSMDESENPLRVRLNWDFIEYANPLISGPEPLSLSMKLFTKWIYGTGIKTSPKDAAGWLEGEEITNVEVLINTISLGCKLDTKQFQDDLLRILIHTPFSVHDNIFKGIQAIKCRADLFDFIIEKYSRQLEDIDDAESLRTRLLNIITVIPESLDEPLGPCSSENVIAAILSCFTTKLDKIRSWIKKLQTDAGDIYLDDILSLEESIWPEYDELLWKNDNNENLGDTEVD